MNRLAMVAIASTLMLSGCATNCGILSSRGDGWCDAALITGMIVTAPVLLPYSMIKNAQEEHAQSERERKLREGVEQGDLAASEISVFNRWRTETEKRAAEQVIDVYAGMQEQSPRQEAVAFAAHKVLADSLWKEDPQARIGHLVEAVRIAQSKEMWTYVRKSSKDGNTLPVNDYYFERTAEDAMIDLITLRYQARVDATGDPNLPMECDRDAFGQLPDNLGPYGPTNEALCRRAGWLLEWAKKNKAAREKKA